LVIYKDHTRKHGQKNIKLLETVSDVCFAAVGRPYQLRTCDRETNLYIHILHFNKIFRVETKYSTLIAMKDVSLF